MSKGLYRRSVIMIMLGGALLSLLGIGMRLMDNPQSLQIIFYRGITQAIFLGILLFFFNSGAMLKPFREMGGKGFLASCFIAIAGFFMVTALMYTNVASAVFIISLAPLASALLGRIFLGELVASRTWLAIAIAVAGIAIIFGDGVMSGGLFGMFLAGMMMLSYSMSIITIRSQSKLKPQADTMAVCALSAILLATGVFPFIDTLQISPHDLAICIGLGVVQMGIGMILIIYGAQHVPAAQVSLLALLEVVLSPIWVWIGVGETPTIFTLVGGVIVLIGVGLQALASGDTGTAQATA